jgi:hypothetical protein
MTERRLTDADQVKALVAPHRSEVPQLAAPTVDLTAYDRLLGEEEAS